MLPFFFLYYTIFIIKTVKYKNKKSYLVCFTKRYFSLKTKLNEEEKYEEGKNEQERKQLSTTMFSYVHIIYSVVRSMMSLSGRKKKNRVGGGGMNFILVC